MGRKPYHEHVKDYNKSNKEKYCMPRKGSAKHKEIMEKMRSEAKKTTKTLKPKRVKKPKQPSKSTSKRNVPDRSTGKKGRDLPVVQKKHSTPKASSDIGTIVTYKVFDFMPMPQSSDLMRWFNQLNFVNAGSIRRSEQTSVECGYIAAYVYARLRLAQLVYGNLNTITFPSGFFPKDAVAKANKTLGIPGTKAIMLTTYQVYQLAGHYTRERLKHTASQPKGVRAIEVNQVTAYDITKKNVVAWVNNKKSEQYRIFITNTDPKAQSGCHWFVFYLGKTR